MAISKPVNADNVNQTLVNDIDIITIELLLMIIWEECYYNYVTRFVKKVFHSDTSNSMSLENYSVSNRLSTSIYYPPDSLRE